jgi:hypothetical protein
MHAARSLVREPGHGQQLGTNDWTPLTAGKVYCCLQHVPLHLVCSKGWRVLQTWLSLLAQLLTLH